MSGIPPFIYDIETVFPYLTKIYRNRMMIMNDKILYRKYSEYLKGKYGEKVYKLPINLPITCPNRVNGGGCSFCAEVGTGFEAMKNTVTVSEQIDLTKELIKRKYKVQKFIAYFQNYTNTYMPLEQFERYMYEAAEMEDIVEISISTRPDCINELYLEILKEIHIKYHIDINIELGLQTVNYHTLDFINRGHGLAEFIDAVLQIKKYGFTICTHIILNLPNDTIRDTLETAKILSALKIDIVKLHSLYIAKNTKLASQYENKEITLCSKEEYLNRLVVFIENLSPQIVVERLFSRVPEEDSIFSNWGTSWWKLQDEFLEKMNYQNTYQGKKCDYLNGAALKEIM